MLSPVPIPGQGGTPAAIPLLPSVGEGGRGWGEHPLVDPRGSPPPARYPFSRVVGEGGRGWGEIRLLTLAARLVGRGVGGWEQPGEP